MKVLIGLLALMLVAAVLWLAGEKHVENCQTARKLNCTVLPWSGDTPSKRQLTEAEERALTRARRLADRAP